MLCLEFTQKRGNTAVTPFHKNSSILPWPVFSPPSAPRRIPLILVNIMHPSACAERFTEHHNPFALQKKPLKVPKCLRPATRFPWRATFKGIGQRIFRREEGCRHTLAGRLKLRAAIVIKRTTAGPCIKKMPPIGKMMQRRRQRQDGVYHPPLQAVSKMLAVEIDRAAIMPAVGLHPHIAVIIFPVAPIVVAIPAFQGAGKNTVSIIKGHKKYFRDKIPKHPKEAKPPLSSTSPQFAILP